MNLHQIWQWLRAHWRLILRTYIIIVSLVSFPLFILEEATQMATFGTWAFKNTRDPEGIKAGCDQIEKINAALKGINTYFGWINPFGYTAYERYGQAVDYYVAETRKAANAPGENQPRNTYANASTRNKTVALSLADTMPFGKYKGMVISSLVNEQPDYVAWLTANVERVKFAEDVQQALAKKSLEAQGK